jgi:hypothetical protein
MPKQCFQVRFPLGGKPAFISMEELWCQKGQNNSHLRKMSKLYGAVCVAIENNTIYAPPSNIYKLRWAEEISIATD